MNKNIIYKGWDIKMNVKLQSEKNVDELSEYVNSHKLKVEGDLVCMSKKSDIMKMYKDANTKVIPIVRNDGVITFKQIDYESDLFIPIMKDEFTGAQYIIIGTYSSHKLSDFILSKYADSYKSIVVSSANDHKNKFSLTFLIKHLDDDISNGNSKELSALLCNYSKHYIIVPQELLQGMTSILNNFDAIRYSLNKVYSIDRIVEPSVIYDTKEEASNASVERPGTIFTEILYNKDKTRKFIF